MEIANLIAAGVAILIGGFIAYHVYFLQKRLTFSDRMQHAASIRRKTKERLYDIRYKDISSEVMIVNTKRFEKDYVSENKKNRHGYVELRAELKDVLYNGVEFFSGMAKQSYYDKKGQITLNKTKKKAFNVLPVGIVPYDWIEYLDLEGDEFRYVPIFYTRFRGQDKYPWKEEIYYRKNNDHYESVDIR